MNTITPTQSPETRWIPIFLMLIFAAFSALLMAPQAHAASSYLNTWSSLYPGSASDNNAGCQLCHGTSTQNINSYGLAVAQCNGASGNISQRIQAVEGADSDGQGDSNLAEISANTQPGWTTGANPVWTRGGCNSVGTNTAPGGLTLDPAPTPTTTTTAAPTTTTAAPTTTTAAPTTTTAAPTTTTASPTTTTASPTTTTTSPTTTTTTTSTTTTTGSTTTTLPATTLTIDSASWSNWRNRVTVKGHGTSRLIVTVVNAYNPSQKLGTDDVSSRRSNWGVRASNPNPVPCRVRATQSDGQAVERDVSNAPSDCAPKGPANESPVADANGPYTGQVGNAVQFSSAGSNDPDGTIQSFSWSFGDGGTSTQANPSHSYAAAGTYTVTLTVTDNDGATASDSTTATISDEPPPPGNGDPVARGDTYGTPLGKTLTVQQSRVSGVLYNDFDTDAGSNNIGNAGLTAVLVDGPTAGSLSYLNADGSFEYTPGATLADNGNDSFTYQARDGDGNLSEVATVNIHIESNQVDFKIMMNYELGMHCTGFEFSYCCVLPPYNSILAQVVKPQTDATPDSDADFPRLLKGDPNNGLDGLGRETVLRDYTQGGGFQKYYLEYFHDAQPRREGNMPGTFNDQTSTLISDAEGNSLLYHNTPFDSAQVDTDGSITGVPGKLVRGSYNGQSTVVVGDGDFTDATDNYANGWMNHFYIYADLEGSNPANTSLEANKIRLGVAGHIEYPKNVGAALHPLGPDGNVSGFDNVLTFSADTGTVVFTQMKVLENLPIMLTAPRIWEALGLPLTPFEDSINFFGEPGAVDEDTIRPYVAMKARLHDATCDANGKCTKGPAVVGSNGQPVIGHGTAPIDIPNCERCHSVPAYQPDGVTPNVNSPSYVRGDFPIYGPAGMTLEAITNLEIEYWKSVYPSLVTGSDWYARLKGAAVNMLAIHDLDTGTGFLNNYPADSDMLGMPPEKAAILQNTRMGHDSVICTKCHGDNVIAAVNPLGPGAGFYLPPISEAIHNRHRNQSEGGTIVFNDALGRDGGCQGCHPAHRSDGVMDNYPITIAGDNANADGDNRLNQGGCFVGRDVHSNPLKDVDGAETPEHLNAVGQWLVDNVSRGQSGEPGGDADNRGIWCTNCHNQLAQEVWRNEDCNSLIHGDCVNDVRGLPSLDAVAAAVGLTTEEAIDYLDPKVAGFDRSTDQTHAVWSPVIPDANVATIEVGPGGPVVTFDGDGDPSVNILSFCTTDDCVDRINANKTDQTQWRYPANEFIDPVTSTAVAVPFDAATDGRDHWLAAGEPHCADCHAAPYTEQSGNINPFPPFNYPAKAGLMRYSRGHQDLSCQACHESIHGLYPVSPAIDTTTYAQAAALNHDGSHGPLKCGTCHEVGGGDIPTWINTGRLGITDYDSAVSWAHTYTDEASVLDTTCLNCHEDERDEMSAGDDEWLEHADRGRTSRLMMDKAEIERFGHVLGTTSRERSQMCSSCHEQELGDVSCDSDWREHLTDGRVSESVWEDISRDETGGTCGW